MTKRTGVRARIGWRLRCWADRVDREHATFLTGWTFTFEPDVGVVFRDDGRGCPVSYFGPEYDRAHDDAGPVAPERVHTAKAWVPTQLHATQLSLTQRDARARWWHLLGHKGGENW
ncbi:hypothetical protein [Rhodococcoides kyotonense]|uniref:Uncharacterized protein n=1 Tax=Rhodococcoides kyotonense TaxID=398843 RepID=A0A239FQ95_9NOCA|nr:hypothetical protein [Rhodococcus kyotonensis]SNS58990.1 hypothetical protein SAMN05421642_103405 [Rhodococcus kyotonensis]